MALPTKVGAKATKRVVALATTSWIILWTWPLYIAQLIGFVFWIMGMGAGMGAEDTWIGWALDITGSVTDMAEIFLAIGMGFGAIAAVLGFLVAYALYFMRGISCFEGHSLIIMALMFGFALTPLSFLPVVWIWCLYVVMSQAKS